MQKLSLVWQRRWLFEAQPVARQFRSKIDEYLLHPIKGRGKAALFQAYGFTLPRWEELRDALFDHAQAGFVQEVVVSPYGSRYIVRGALLTPGGRVPLPVVCAVWHTDHGAEGVRRITAYPA